CGTKVPYYGNSSLNWDTKPAPEDSLVSHTVYLSGNIDFDSGDDIDAINMLDSTLKNIDPGSNSLIILGDITRNNASTISLIDKIDSSFNGRILFLPGDKDWNKGKKSGNSEVKKLEEQINRQFENKNVFFPGKACPGPEALSIDENLVVVFMDSQWWLHQNEKPIGESSGCKAVDKFSYLLRLEELLESHKEKNILLVQHHPLFSNGNHGGFFSFKNHVFPLTFLQRGLYIPLPLVGSVYPVLRHLGINKQDLAHPNYKKMKKELLSIIENRPNIIMVTAHDYSLQHKKHKELHHVVSGAAVATAYTQKKNQVEFASQQIGLAKINFYRTGESWLEFLALSEDNKPEVVYRTNLNALNPKDSNLKKRDLK